MYKLPEIDGYYRAPWSRNLKIMTWTINIFISLIGLFLLVMGIKTIRSGDSSGWFLAVISLVPMSILFLVRLFAPKGYRIAEDGVYILKNVGQEKIPFEKIKTISVLDSKQIFASAMRVCGSGGYYGTYGSFSGGILSSFRAQVTNNGPLVVLYLTKGDPVVISPENPEDFTKRLYEKKGVPPQEIQKQGAEGTKIYNPPYTLGEIVLEVLAVILLITVIGIAVIYWDKLPQTIPMHFNAEGTPDGWGSKGTIFILPGVSLFIYLLFTVITVVASKKNTVTQDNPYNRRNVDFFRWILGVLKCTLLGLFGFLTWSTVLVAMGKASGLGTGFSAVILMIFAVGEPALLIFFAVYYTKSQKN